MEKTIFSRIIDREIPAQILFEDDRCIVIEDIAPRAPVHLLVVPKNPITRLVDATAEDQELLGHLMLIAGQMAKKSGAGDNFRLLVNNGEGAGQTVFHLHLHILGNKKYNEQDTDF